MSGSASSGIRFIDQIPAITSRKVPVNTRNRLRAHHSMIQLITLHSSRGVHRELLACNHSPVLVSDNEKLPSPAYPQIPLSFIHATAFVVEIHAVFHCCHSHGRHRRHEKRDGYLRSADRRSVGPGQLHAENVAALLRRSWIGGQLNIALSSDWRRSHRGSSARSRRRRNESSCGSLQLGL